MFDRPKSLLWKRSAHFYIHFFILLCTSVLEIPQILCCIPDVLSQVVLLSSCCLYSFHFCMFQPCFPGLISSVDRVDCRLCPAGFSCDPANGTFSLCPLGQHSPEGVLQCLACPVDSVCTSGFPHKVTMAINTSSKNVLYWRKKKLQQ